MGADQVVDATYEVVMNHIKKNFPPEAVLNISPPQRLEDSLKFAIVNIRAALEDAQGHDNQRALQRFNNPPAEQLVSSKTNAQQVMRPGAESSYLQQQSARPDLAKTDSPPTVLYAMDEKNRIAPDPHSPTTEQRGALSKIHSFLA